MAIIELKIHDIKPNGGTGGESDYTNLTILTNKKYDGTVTAGNTLKLKGESGKDNQYSFYITDFSFKKIMYEPTAIKVRLDVYPVAKGREEPTWDPIVKDNIVTTLLNNKVELLSLIDEKTADKDKKVIGSDYYIADVQPHYKPDSMFIILKIFSLDHMLTFKQDSRTFVAKKFFSEILEKELVNYKLPWDPQKTITCKNNMKVLTYKGKDDKMTEHIFPYLVQYNESFQDMAIRTANRWGEFFFYENGTINVGYDATAEAVEKKDWQELTYCDIDDGIEVEFAEKFAAEAAYDDNVIVSNVNKDPQEIKGQMGCDSDHDLDKWIMKQFPMFFSNTKNIPTWITNALFDNTYNLLVAKTHIGDLNDISNEKYFSKTTPAEQYGYETDPKKLNLFSELNSDFTEKRYRNILLKELQASKNAVVLDYDTTYPDLKLGQIIKVQNKEYLVVNVECKTEEKRLVLNKEQEVVPLDTTPTLLFKVKAISKITNWKNLDGKEEPDTFCPTIIPAGHIRTSGPQLATVTDADDPNNQNRVRIMFPAWQNVPETMDDKTKEASSPWIVYATSSASKGNGIFGRHYEGDQVIVNFAHGNVERPYIVGGLSMKGNKVPGEFLERDIVLTSPGGHALRIEDGSGAGLTAFLSGTILPGYELLTTWFPSLGGQDIFKLFGNDTLSKNSKGFEGGFQLTDKYGVYSITGSTDGRNVSVKSPWGDVNISAFTGISIEAPNGDISIKGKNVSIEAGNNLELISGTNVSYRKFKHGDSGLGTVGLSLAEIPIAAAKKLASKINIIDFSYLRSIAEVVFRPVEGALTVKSNRFLKLEAGKDQCDYPAAAYTSQALKSKHAKDEKAIRKGIKTQASVIELISKVGVLAGEVDRKYRENYRNCVNHYKLSPSSLMQTIEHYRYLAEGFNTNGQVQICKTFNDMDNIMWANPPYKKITEDNLGFLDCFQIANANDVTNDTIATVSHRNQAIENLPSEDEKKAAIINERKRARKDILKSANTLREAICKFLEHRELKKEEIGKQIGWFVTSAVPENYRSAMEKAFSKSSLAESFYYQDLTVQQKSLDRAYTEAALGEHRKVLKRMAAVAFLEALGFKDEWRRKEPEAIPNIANNAIVAPAGAPGIPQPPAPAAPFMSVPKRPTKYADFVNQAKWNRYVNSLESIPRLDAAQYAAAKTALDALKGLVNADSIMDWHKTRIENSSWSNAKNGSILFTHNGNTYALNENIAEIEGAAKENLTALEDPDRNVYDFLNAIKDSLKHLE